MPTKLHTKSVCFAAARALNYSLRIHHSFIIRAKILWIVIFVFTVIFISRRVKIPWLEAIELQDSAYPYHDWNERITAECYAPNAASRILTSDRSHLRIVNNYSRISFNFGPTLLSWMDDRAPEIYQAILDADRESHDRFPGTVRPSRRPTTT